LVHKIKVTTYNGTMWFSHTQRVSTTNSASSCIFKSCATITKYMGQSSSSEANSHLVSQEIPGPLWNRRFITVFTRARHWSLSWARWIQSIPFHPISTIILPSTLRSSEWSLPFRFSDHNILCISHLPCVLYDPLISFSWVHELISERYMFNYDVY
jgi:hypothetical protein